MALKQSNYDPAIKYGAEVDAEINFDDAVDTDDIADDAVVTAKILDANITTAKLATNAVETVKIKDGNVTEAKLATNSVNTDQIKNGAVTDVKISGPRLTALQATVTYDQFTDGGAAVGTFDIAPNIPAGAVAVRTLLTAITGFAGDTSAVITVGDGTDADRYNTGTPNVFGDVAVLDAGAVSGTAFHSVEKTVKLTVTSNASFASVSAGSVTVTTFYYTT